MSNDTAAQTQLLTGIETDSKEIANKNTGAAGTQPDSDSMKENITSKQAEQIKPELRI